MVQDLQSPISASAAAHSAALPAALPAGVARREAGRSAAASSAASAAAKRAELLAKVAAYADYPPNWNNAGGRAPEQIDIDNALAFIPHIPDRAAMTVQICTTGDGEICFSWSNHAAKHFFDVSFDFGGQMCFYGDLPSGRGVGADDAPYDKSAPPPAELLRFLSGLTF